MKAFIGSYFIDKHPGGNGEKYTAYQIVDYVGRDHILVEEEGWAAANTKFAPQENSVVINLGDNSTHKTSIIEIGEFIEYYQKDIIWFCFFETEIKKKLTELVNDLCRCVKNENYDEWIKALTKEICEK